mmetsp:Transcript_1985/g.3572  ORF Transcript_1985/g.3572 Transcript_1985/m.3572 type:complete len:222 (-) Transcript_1985:749-1414(-)
MSGILSKRGVILYSRNKTLRMVLTWIKAKFCPMHECMPPPKPRYAYGCLCSSRPGPNRSGSNVSGLGKTEGKRIPTDGLTKTISPLGMTYCFPPALTGTSFMAFRMSKIRGGHKRNASRIQSCNNCISLILSKSKGAPGSSITCSCSSMMRFIMEGSEAIKRDVQVELMHEVCCPAKRSAIKSPVTCSSEIRDPSLYLISMKMDKMSVPSECLALGLSRRF